MRHSILRLPSVIVLAAHALSFLLLNGCDSQDEKARTCRVNISQLYMMISSYKSEYGVFPPSLELATSNFLIGSSSTMFCSCPGCGYDAKPIKGIDARADYSYIPWLPDAPIHDDWPILFDNSWSNHKGMGIIIITINGDAIWDDTGTILTEFNREHPDYTVPLPASYPKIEGD